MVRGLYNISIPTVGYNAAQGRKMSFLVDPSSYIYSHFENVSGISAPNGTQGVAISKLNLLDVLIGRLNQIKRGAEVDSSQDIDALIDNYTTQIQQAMTDSTVMPYIPSPSAEAGAVFSLVV